MNEKGLKETDSNLKPSAFSYESEISMNALCCPGCCWIKKADKLWSMCVHIECPFHELYTEPEVTRIVNVIQYESRCLYCSV